MTDLPLWVRIAIFLVVAIAMIRPLVIEIMKEKWEMDLESGKARRMAEARMIKKMCKMPGAWGKRKK